MTPNRRGYRTWLAPALIAVAALATRFGFLFGSPDRTWPHGVCYEGDAPLWVRWAAALIEGKRFEFDLPVHAPGLAFLMAGLLESNALQPFLLGKVVLCLVGAASCVLVLFLGRSVFGPAAAVVAAILCAGSFGLTVQNGSLNNETLYTFLLLIALGLTDWAGRTRFMLPPLLLGIAHGLAVLLRPEHAVLFAILWLYSWKKRPTATTALSGPRNRARAQVIVLGVFFLVPLPWNIRSFFAIQRFNHEEPQPIAYDQLRPPWTPDAVSRVRALPAFAREGNVRHLSYLANQANLIAVDREFVDRFFAERMKYVPQPMSPLVFVSNQAALSFALANNSQSDGGFSTALLNPTGPTDFAFGNPRHLRLYQQGFSIGFDFLIHHPRETGELLLNKLSIFASGLTSGLTILNWPLGSNLIRRPVDQSAVPIGHVSTWTWSLIGLAVTGIAASIFQRRGFLWLLVLVYKLLITLAFYGYARQAVSVLPLFYLFAAFGLDFLLLRPLVRMLPAVRRMNIWATATATLFLVGIAVWSARQGWEYYVDGPAESSPQWGPGAFESAQLLKVERVMNARE